MSALSWSQARDLLGIVEKRIDDEFGVPAKVVEDWKHRFAAKAFDIAESYVEGELAFVISLRARGEIFDDCEFLLVAVPPVIRDAPITLSSPLELEVSGPRLWLDGNPVLVGTSRVPDSVDCVVSAGVVIPSLVWLKVAEGRPENIWDFLAPVREIRGVFRPGEVDVLSRSSAKHSLDRSIHGLIDAVPQIADDAKGQPPPRNRRALSDPDLMRICAGLRIEVSDLLYRVVIEEPINAALQSVNVVPCPLQK